MGAECAEADRPRALPVQAEHVEAKRRLRRLDRACAERHVTGDHRHVAAGRFDAYWAYDNKVWDVAGGAVLIREAGGTLTVASAVTNTGIVKSGATLASSGTFAASFSSPILNRPRRRELRQK